MLLTQFMTLGLLTLAAAGGVALGYGVRSRQERLIAGRRLADDQGLKLVGSQETPLAIEGRGRRARPPARLDPEKGVAGE
jgi:hypothetical protein